MTLNRWWHAAVAAISAVLVVMLLVSASEPWRLALGFGAVAVFLVAWALFSRRAVDGNREALLLAATICLVGGAGTAAEANFAIFQCVAFPLIWVLAKTTRGAIVANIVAGLAVGVGFLFGRPIDTIELFEIALTVMLSIGFSIALGLWITQIATQSEQRQELISELEATREKLALVSHDAGTVAERERLARDIHDTIAQDLTGLVMLAQRARRETDATTRDTLLAQLEDGARDALSETRTLVAAGAPASLDGGLLAALERFAARFARDSGITVTVSSDGVRLDRDTEVVALRCTQEALANVRKHSGATRASVTLTGTALVISDDGGGFDLAAPSEGFGLSGMRDRLALAGGSLETSSGASGTTLTIMLDGATDSDTAVPAASAAADPAPAGTHPHAIPTLAEAGA